MNIPSIKSIRFFFGNECSLLKAMSYFEEEGRHPLPAHEAVSKVRAALSNGRHSFKRMATETAESVSARVQNIMARRKSENVEQLHTLAEKPGTCFIRKKRWQIALMANLGFIIAFGIRCNFGAAKGRMINNFTDPFGNNFTKEFFWTPTQLGIMESAFFYGYAITQIPGGMLAAKFAPNKLFGLSIFIAAVLNLFLALALKAHPYTDFIVVSIQVSQGLSLGVSYPAMHGVWRHWAPPMERSKLATTTFTGGYLGVMLGLPLSAYLVSYIDWSTPFFFYGVVGIIWTILWFRISGATPAKCRNISEDERRYIIEHVGHVSSSPATLTTIPWKLIFLSLPVWAIVICNFCRSWTFFLLLGNQLTYMSDVLHLEIHSGGLIGSLPHILMSIVVLSSGQIADHLRSTGKMSTTAVRKLFNSLGFAAEATFLCCLAFITEPTIAITILVLSTGCSGFAIAGFNVNHFDIAPRYAPILMGFSNGVGALAGVSGFALEHLVAKEGTLIGWRTSFLMAMCVDIIALISFLVFGTGELQEWAKEEEPQQSMKDIVRRLSSVVRRVSSIRHSKSSMKHSRLKEEDGVSVSSDLSRTSSVKQTSQSTPSQLPTITEAHV
uniref:Major facilitator superfamily (MFS) profile domain-containing protein n=1 Tax=Parascaris univalens TaxID=6257 RepID=A0A915BPQ4_PARUN